VGKNSNGYHFEQQNIAKYFFGKRVVKIWNSFPAIVEDFASLRKFKSFIERVDLSQYVNF